jgi:hypothetical protein
MDYSDYFIDETINLRVSAYQSTENMNNLRDMNIYLLENIKGAKIIIDPEKKSISDL